MVQSSAISSDLPAHAPVAERNAGAGPTDLHYLDGLPASGTAGYSGRTSGTRQSLRR